MKPKFLFLIIAIAFMTGCTDPVEKANEIISKRLDAVLSDDIQFASSSMYFLNYAVATNYWYPSETSYREIMDDSFDQGIYGLKRLKSRANEIITTDENINNAISQLNIQIDSSLIDLKKKKKSCESLNGLFGFMLFGGTSGVSDLNDAMSTPEEKEKLEREKTQMPPKVLAKFNELVTLLESKFFTDIPYKINQLETEAIDNRRIDFNQHDNIRINLKQKIKEKIIEQYHSEDLQCRDHMISDLFSAFNDRYPIKEN